MSGVDREPSRSAERGGSIPTWTSVQAYVLASFCLILGVALGYLFRGSASSVAQAAPVMAEQSGAQTPAADTEAALQQQVAPFLEVVKKNPRDYDSLVKLGDMYYDAKEYPNAIQYYGRALAIHPESPDVRSDMATAFWYTGDADRALAEMETSLKYQPGHPQTLFNLGWVRWQGKADAMGAVDAWQKLLKANPEYPQKQQVEQYIAKAKEHAAKG